MARDFSKVATNKIELGANAFGSLLGGLAQVTFHAWVQLDTASATANQGQFVGAQSGSNNVFQIGISGSTTAPVLQLTVRTTGVDGAARTGTTAVSLGEWHSIAIVVDYAGNAVSAYIDGIKDRLSGTFSFSNPNFPTTAGTGADRLGAGPGGTNPATSAQADGRGAEFAFWPYALGDDQIQLLAEGVPAPEVDAGLVFYAPLYGLDSPEPDIVSGKVGTISGSVPGYEHPPLRPRAVANAGYFVLAGGGASNIDGTGTGTVAFSPTAGASALSSGVGSSPVSFSASAPGSSIANAAGSSTVAMSVSSQGSALFSGSGSSSVSMSVAGSGSSLYASSGAASLSSVASGAGAALFNAAGSSSVSLAGSGYGLALFDVAGSSNLDLSAAGSGGALTSASGSATAIFGSSGYGDAVAEGQGSATISISASSVGASVVSGIGSGSVVFSGIGTSDSAGFVDRAGSATVSFSLSGMGSSLFSSSGSAGIELSASAFARVTARRFLILRYGDRNLVLGSDQVVQ